MKRLFSIVLFVLLSVAVMGQMAEDYTVRFVGRLNGTQYQRMDSVKFTNTTRGWTETVVYPDTVIVLFPTVNVSDAGFVPAGFEQNVPNPFDCHTTVELAIPQDESVRLQLFDAAGKQCTELKVSLNAGSHRFEITASKPQTYILKAIVGDQTYSVRMVNVGSGGNDGISYGGHVGITAKLYSDNEFVLGDVIQYVGYATIEGNVVESRAITQALYISQEVILQFTYYFRPSVETLAASGIQVSGAYFNGNIIYDGGSAVVERGFVYGLDPDDLSSCVVSNSTSANFSIYVSGLQDGTTYYYRAYATNAQGTSYGETVSFTTRRESIPTVTTGSLPDVRATCAIVSGRVYGGVTVISRGFVYGTDRDDLSLSIECGRGIGDFSGMLTGMNAGTTYYYRAFATSSAGTGYGDIMSLTTEQQSGTINGYEWIDLGLPSGTLWAKSNVGANTSTAYGDYYAWAETTTKSSYRWNTYEYCNGSIYTLTKYCGDQIYGYNGYTDTLTQVDVWDDVATIVCGGSWRMPTRAEMIELYENCTVALTNQNGVDGMLFTATNGNSIFLPAGGWCHDGYNHTDYTNGYYWTKSLYQTRPTSSYSLFFDNNGNVNADTLLSRCDGLTVRPVRRTVRLIASVVTGDVSCITSASAIVEGWVNDNPNCAETSFGFLYGTDPDNLTEFIPSDGTFEYYGSLMAAPLNLLPSTTYYYQAYASNVFGTSYGEIKTFTTLASSTATYSSATGSASGHGYVNLGLPSGTLWATCNVGANSPEESGIHYSWGETTPNGVYSWESYRYAAGTTSMDPRLTKYCSSSTYGNNGFTDNLTALQPSDDAATANWGSDWRMPTYSELRELWNYCSKVWVTLGGNVNGLLLTGPNGNKIFLPAAGDKWYHQQLGVIHSEKNILGIYWTKDLDDDPRCVKRCSFIGTEYRFCDSERVTGVVVRPVKNNR